MGYFWLAVIVVSVVPAAAGSFYLNPLVFLLLGPDAWREQVGRLYPYRWLILASFLTLALSTAIYGTQYA